MDWIHLALHILVVLMETTFISIRLPFNYMSLSRTIQTLELTFISVTQVCVIKHATMNDAIFLYVNNIFPSLVFYAISQSARN